MSIGTALTIYALADADIADAIADRMSPQFRPQDTATPAATCQVITSSPDEALDGDIGHQTDRIQFDLYGDDSDELDRIARRLRLRLLTASGDLPIDETDTPATLWVTGVSTAGGIRQASTSNPLDASDSWQFRVSFDLHVSYHPAS